MRRRGHAADDGPAYFLTYFSAIAGRGSEHALGLESARGAVERECEGGGEEEKVPRGLDEAETAAVDGEIEREREDERDRRDERGLRRRASSASPRVGRGAAALGVHTPPTETTRSNLSPRPSVSAAVSATSAPFTAAERSHESAAAAFARERVRAPVCASAGAKYCAIAAMTRGSVERRL